MSSELREEIWKNIVMAAQQGWKISFYFENGDDFKEAFVTQMDEENRAFLLERIGERHLKPKLAYFLDVKDVKLHW